MTRVQPVARRLVRPGLVAAGVALAVALAACGRGTGPEGGAGSAVVAFRAAGGGGVASAVPGATVGASHSTDGEASTLTVEGSNGRLTVASVHFVLEEFELERDDDTEAGCDAPPTSSLVAPDDDGDDGAEEGGDDAADEDDDEQEAECEEFEAPRSFVALPLSGEGVVAAQQEVPAGRYDELEFEIEDLEEEEDGEDASSIQALLTEIRDEFPHWPREASLRIHGTFTPKDESGALLESGARTFTAYFEAEVEIEQELAPPLEITGGSQTVTVVVDPGAWLHRSDGRVVDLSRLDFDPDAGTPVPELELELETEVAEAFVTVEVGG